MQSVPQNRHLMKTGSVVLAILMVGAVVALVSNASFKNGNIGDALAIVKKESGRQSLCVGYLQDAANDKTIAQKLRKKGKNLLAEQYVFRSQAYMSAYKLCVDPSVSMGNMLKINNGILMNLMLARAKANELQAKKMRPGKGKQAFLTRAKEYSFRAKGARFYGRYLATKKTKFFRKALAAMTKARKFGALAELKKLEARECQFKLSHMKTAPHGVTIATNAKFYLGTNSARSLTTADLVQHQGQAKHFRKSHNFGDSLVMITDSNWGLEVKNEDCSVMGVYEPDQQTGMPNAALMRMFDEQIHVEQDCFIGGLRVVDDPAE